MQPRKHLLTQALRLFAALLALNVSACGSSPETETTYSFAAGAGGHENTIAAGGAAGLGASAQLPSNADSGTELCDGIDNDGNGKIDEGCACQVGQTQPCYPGALATRNKGVCLEGKQTCDKLGEFSRWGDCVGYVVPTQESPDGLDNDCNGIVDDVCKPRSAEVCNNGIDDDCNGKIDCQDSACPPCAEDCANGTDDDGDGNADCKDTDCTNASNCKEVCADGADNDGDGLVDCQDPDCPACKENCSNQVDDDADGSVDCQDSDCAGEASCHCGIHGECCNGKDDNLDGRIDEGNVCDGVAEPCPPGAIQSCDCYCGVHRKCTPEGTWGPCLVDGSGSCGPAQITSHAQCGPNGFCDYGECYGKPAGGTQCVHHSDCPMPFVCDLGNCVPDSYFPCP